MPFDWKAFVELARSLQQEGESAANSEAFLRSALSRAYFGAFGHARNYAKNYLGFVPHEASEDHGRLRHHLKTKRRKGDGDRLEQLRIWRNDSDYADDLSSLDLRTTVSRAIAFAERVFSSLEPPKPKGP